MFDKIAILSSLVITLLLALKAIISLVHYFISLMQNKHMKLDQDQGAKLQGACRVIHVSNSCLIEQTIL